MNVVTRQEVVEAAKRFPYWRGRWDAYVRDLVELLAAYTFPPDRLLEVGPGEVPLVPGSTRLERRPVCPGAIVHDIGKTWPFPDDSMEVVLACQVWEHLSPAAKIYAFQEARRVGGTILLTVPHMWQDTDVLHRGISDVDVWSWASGLVADVVRDFGPPCRVRRLYVWRSKRRRSS